MLHPDWLIQSAAGNVRALEKTLEVAAETAWGGRGDVDRFLRAAVACAAAPPWRTTGPPPRPCLNVTRCLLAALLEERHDLTPLFHLPARGISPEAGALWLAARRGSGSVGLVPSAHSLLAAVLGQICGLVLADTAMEAMSIVQDSLASWAIGQHLGFCRYVETSPPEWLDEAGSVAVGLCGAAGDSFIAAVAILAEIQKQPHLLQAAKVLSSPAADFPRFATYPLVRNVLPLPLRMRLGSRSRALALCLGVSHLTPGPTGAATYAFPLPLWIDLHPPLSLLAH